MIRVLLVDDSATDRALLGEIFRRDADVLVVGEARDGVEAAALTQRLSPQVVVMDLHMPRMDGLTATKEIMTSSPTPIVIVTGSLRANETEAAMHALRAGALAVLRKPPGPAAADFEEAAKSFLTTIKSMAEVKVVRRWRSAAPSAVPSRQGLPRPVEAGFALRLVCVAASTGGPEALQHLFVELPGDFAAPILVVQHITPGFTAGLAAWLNSVCDLRVKIADNGEVLAAHTVYLAPDDRHLTVGRPGHILLSQAPPVGGFRPSATPLFESAARLYGPATAAVILTGMGDDGVEGLRAVHQAGGRIFAQDEKSCVVFGMPGAAVAEGLADLVLPPDAIAARLLHLV
jgi:two-component system chemotaxis response regulator CheB